MKKEHNNNKYNIKFYKGICKITNFYLDKMFKPNVIGQEKVQDEPILFVGNHKSGYDILLMAYALKKYGLRFMAKKEFFDGKFGWFFEKCGAFPIDRTKTDMTAVKTAIKLLKEQEKVIIFPEGTRNNNDELLSFKKGYSTIALLSSVKVIPFAITGEYKFRKRPTIEFDDPIDLKSLDIDKKELDSYIEERVKNLIKNSR